MAVYIFDCPVHGEETKAFCFRAFAEENKTLWRKLEAKFTPAAFERNELDEHLNLNRLKPNAQTNRP